MTTFLALWSSLIPNTPLVLAHGTLMCAATIGLLLLCTVALWFERDQQETPLETVHGDEERLAA